MQAREEGPQLADQKGGAALLPLGELRDTQVDMFTTVFVGNSQTKVIGGKMVTPRGYLQRGE